MTAPIAYGTTDSAAHMPRWLTLVLISVATLVAIGTLWSLAPAGVACADYGYGYGAGGDQILPGPQPCPVTDARGPALVTAGLLLTLLAAIYVVSFTMTRLRARVVMILGGAMLLVFAIGLAATVTLANTPPPIIYY